MARPVRLIFTATLAVLVLFGMPAWANDSDSAESDGTAGSDSRFESQGRDSSESSGGATYNSSADASAATKSKFEVHGFLTQAYATGNFVDERLPGPGGVDPGPTFDELALGIPEDGTFDYRTVAIQFRYQIAPKDVMVVQFSSRALGDSPIEGIEDEVELDWAFYERRLADNTSVKIGRVQIPLGIFNEIRDVGTILPFYRPAFSFYREGSFTSETVDGIAFSHIFWPESNWSLETDLWAGNWESVELTIFDPTPFVADEEGYGLQLWLNTPSPGLRLGYGFHQRDTSGGAEGFGRPIGGETSIDDWYASIDAVYDKVVFRAEYREFNNDPGPFPAFGATDLRTVVTFGYAQLGYHFSEKFRVYVQAEFNDVLTQGSIFVDSFEATFREDVGISFNYLFRPDLVLKAEYHTVGGEDQGAFPAFGPGGQFLGLQLFAEDFGDGDYSIISLSTSF